MIMGIGVDMVSEARVARSIKRPGFLEKVYGPAERALLEGRGMRPQTAAANFAAKEAFGKALGTGLLREFALCEAEALRDENGAPYFSFSGRAAALMQARGLTAHLSLTHELSLIHISEPTRLGMISYAVFCLKKKNKKRIPSSA